MPAGAAQCSRPGPSGTARVTSVVKLVKPCAQVGGAHRRSSRPRSRDPRARKRLSRRRRRSRASRLAVDAADLAEHLEVGVVARARVDLALRALDLAREVGDQHQSRVAGARSRVSTSVSRKRSRRAFPAQGRLERDLDSPPSIPPAVRGTSAGRLERPREQLCVLVVEHRHLRADGERCRWIPNIAVMRASLIRRVRFCRLA